jgi:hypothetical protein
MDPDSYGSSDLDWGSGSRQARIVPQKGKNLKFGFGISNSLDPDLDLLIRIRYGIRNIPGG